MFRGASLTAHSLELELEVTYARYVFFSEKYDVEGGPPSSPALLPVDVDERIEVALPVAIFLHI